MSRKIVIEFEVYKIDEHPDKAKCFEWVRENMHWLAEHEQYDLITSLKALQKTIGGKLDWCLSSSPYRDRGEFIRFTDYDKEALSELDTGTYTLTGVYCDDDVIECVKNGDTDELVDRLHDWCEYRYSDESIEEIAENNNWEFTIEGKKY
tara:strand:- start:88 stop:537 length:450 start_codon:yes stop_codon:yes gene_type:complete